MGFITESDFDDVIKANILDDVIDGSSDAFDQAVEYAQGITAGYISARFDVTDTFGKTGSDRSTVVVNIMKDLTLHRLLQRIDPRAVPETYSKAYDSSMKLLKDIQKGNFCPQDLKALQDTSVDPAMDEANIRMGGIRISNKRY